MKSLAAFLIPASVALGGPALQERIAISEFKEEAYFRSFGQYLQQESGEFTRESGRVLIVKTSEGFELAFYQKKDEAFVRVGAFVEFLDTGLVTLETHIGKLRSCQAGIN